MNQQDILGKLNTILDQHTKEDRGAMSQTSYKDDIFKLFVTAYQNRYFETSSRPRLTGDAIKDYFFEIWMREENDFNKRKEKYLIALLNMWNEWYYAWSRYEELHEK